LSKLKKDAETLGYSTPRLFFDSLHRAKEFEITASINGQFTRVEFIDKYSTWEELTVLLIERKGEVAALDRNELTSLESIYEKLDEFDYLG
tara:strand:+ start:769 stop:1041 length:273 start_codon:yes stop_codon:yes gene_type:complete